MKRHFYYYAGLAFITIIFMNSCCKAHIGLEVYYNNNSEHDVELNLYEDGAYTTFTVKRKTIEPFGPTGDSVLVYVNNALEAIHYPENTSNSVFRPKVIRYADTGNLYNFTNYTREKIELKCNGNITKLTYVYGD